MSSQSIRTCLVHIRNFFFLLTSSTHQVCVVVIFSAYILNILVESASSQMCSFHSITSQTQQKKQKKNLLMHCGTVNSVVTITNENIIGSHLFSCNVMSSILVETCSCHQLGTCSCYIRLAHRD